MPTSGTYRPREAEVHVDVSRPGARASQVSARCTRSIHGEAPVHWTTVGEMIGTFARGMRRDDTRHGSPAPACARRAAPVGDCRSAGSTCRRTPDRRDVGTPRPRCRAGRTSPRWTRSRSDRLAHAPRELGLRAWNAPRRHGAMDAEIDAVEWPLGPELTDHPSDEGRRAASWVTQPLIQVPVFGHRGDSMPTSSTPSYSRATCTKPARVGRPATVASSASPRAGEPG